MSETPPEMKQLLRFNTLIKHTMMPENSKTSTTYSWVEK